MNENSGAQPTTNQQPAEPVQPQTVSQPQEDIRQKREQMKLDAQEASLDVYRQAMKVSTTFMDPNIWSQIRSMAKIFHDSRALPACIQNEPQLVMVLQAGFEMGMTPVESIKSLYIVNGTINTYAAATVKRLKEHGWVVKYTDENETSCTAVITKDGQEYSETMTLKMAEDSGYTKDRGGNLKVGWKAGLNRKLKLRYGALSIIIKTYVPEVLGAANDIAEVAEDAVIDITPEEKKQPVAEQEPVKPSSLADRLHEKHAKQIVQKQAPEHVMAEKETTAQESAK